jgi:hypothetical protein
MRRTVIERPTAGKLADVGRQRDSRDQAATRPRSAASSALIRSGAGAAVGHTSSSPDCTTGFGNNDASTQGP